MDELLAALDLIVNYPRQWAGTAICLRFLLGVVRFTPPAADGRCPVCNGDMETCTCGTPKAPLPRAVPSWAKDGAQ